MLNAIQSTAKYSSPQKGESKVFHNLLICQEGAFLAIAGAEAYALQAGEALLIPSHTFFSISQFEENSLCLSISFEGEEIEATVCSKIAPSLARHLYEWFDEEECKPLVELILLRMRKEPSLTPIKNKRELSLFFEATALLEQDLINAPSPEALAARLGISLSSLKRLFANLIGIGVHEYLIDRRIDLAKQYLKSGRSVTETAALCGFANQAYFSAAFKKATERSPKEYIGSKKAPVSPKESTHKPKQKEMPSYLL